MALLEYDIQYDEKTGTSKVTCQVLEVEKDDRISFKSNYDDTGIKYQTGSPFSDPNGPKAGEFFKVGAGTKGPFRVVKSLTAKTRLHFDCGEMVQKSASGSNYEVNTPATFRSWGSGDGTPPEDVPTDH